MKGNSLRSSKEHTSTRSASWRDVSLVFCLEGMILNNSRGARINISYSIFDVPTNRLKTVSFQLAPLLPTKGWQTHRERAARCCCVVLLLPVAICFLLIPLTLPLFRLCRIGTTIVPLVSPYPGIKRFCPARKTRFGFVFKTLLISSANWLRCKPSQQACDFDVTF